MVAYILQATPLAHICQAIYNVSRMRKEQALRDGFLFRALADPTRCVCSTSSRQGNLRLLFREISGSASPRFRAIFPISGAPAIAAARARDAGCTTAWSSRRRCGFVHLERNIEAFAGKAGLRRDFSRLDSACLQTRWFELPEKDPQPRLASINLKYSYGGGCGPYFSPLNPEGEPATGWSEPVKVRRALTVTIFAFCARRRINGNVIVKILMVRRVCG